MHRKIAHLFATVLFSTFALVSCGGTDQEEPVVPEETAAQEQNEPVQERPTEEE